MKFSNGSTVHFTENKSNITHHPIDGMIEVTPEEMDYWQAVNGIKAINDPLLLQAIELECQNRQRILKQKKQEAENRNIVFKSNSLSERLKEY